MTEQTPTIIHLTPESDGTFVIDERIERAVWDRMKAAGASYYNQDWLDDNDMFDGSTGWHYPQESIIELLRAGYAVAVLDQVVTDIAVFQAMWTREAVEARRVAQIAAHEAALQRQRAAEVEARLVYNQAKREYEAWKEAALAGLIVTSAWPLVDVEWTRLEVGAALDVAWDQATVDGVTVYKSVNGGVRYAPQQMADAWTIAAYERGDLNGYFGSAPETFARNVLGYYDWTGVSKSDLAAALVRHYGLDYWRERAVATEWVVTETQMDEAKTQRAPGLVAQRHDLPVTVVRRVRELTRDEGSHPAFRAATGTSNTFTTLLRADDGRHFAASYGYYLHELNTDELSALDQS